VLDLQEIRENDMDSGRFDIYTDDIDFSDEQYVELRMKDKVRVSEINPVDIENPEIFEHIKKVTDYIKRVADAVCPNGYKVFDNKIMSYVKVILNEVNKDKSCLDKISRELFKENYLLEAILMRDVVVRFSEYKLKYGDKADNKILGNFYLEFQEIEEIIKRKKFGKQDFEKNIVVKKTDEKLDNDDNNDVTKLDIEDNIFQ
jgi:hypothetical protein